MKTGKRYQYTEEGWTAPVFVAEDKSDDEWEKYILLTEGPLGPIPEGTFFEASWRRGYANILWKLTPLQYETENDALAAGVY